MNEEAESQPSEREADDELEETPIDVASFVERVEDLDAELAEEAETLEAHLEDLEGSLEQTRQEVDELTSRLKRAHADFENYKKRVSRRRDAQRAEATRRLVDRLLDIRQDLRRAIEAEGQSVDDLVEGVKLTVQDLDRLLDAEDVHEIDPPVGDPVDPHRHEVMVRVDSDQPADTIAEVLEPGFRHGDTVLREARVSVSDGEEPEE